MCKVLSLLYLYSFDGNLYFALIALLSLELYLRLLSCLAWLQPLPPAANLFGYIESDQCIFSASISCYSG